MPTFPKGFYAYAVRVQNAKLAAEEERDARPLPKPLTPADALDLRGIPALGRGVSGAIRGTSPHGHVCR